MNEFLTFYKDYVDTAKSINLDITTVCPLQCPFCDRQKYGKDRIKSGSEMSLKTFEMILNSMNKIDLCGQISDPIYHKYFIEIMKLINLPKYRNKRIVISTNGTRKKTQWWEKVFKLSHSNVFWSFGLDGTDQETANIYRVNTRYDEVLEVMKLGSSMNVNIEWKFIVFKHNEHQIDDLLKLGKEHKINIQILKSNRWIPRIMNNIKIEKPSAEWTSPKSKQNKIKYINKG